MPLKPTLGQAFNNYVMQNQQPHPQGELIRQGYLNDIEQINRPLSEFEMETKHPLVRAVQSGMGALTGAASRVSDAVLRTPEVVGRMAGYQTPAQMATSSLYGAASDYIRGEGEELANTFDPDNEWELAAQRANEQPVLDSLKDPAVVLGSVANAVPTLAAAMLAGPVGSIPYITGMEASGLNDQIKAYEEATGQKVTQSAYNMAMAQHLPVAVAMERIGLKGVTAPLRGQILQKGAQILGKGGVEAGTEVAQEFSGNRTMQHIDPTQRLDEGLVSAGIGGGGSGVTMGAVQAQAPVALSTDPIQLKAQVQGQIDRLSKKLGYNIDVRANLGELTPEELAQVQQHADENGIDPNAVDAMWIDGKIIILSDKMGTDLDIEKKAHHEAAAHDGVRKYFNGMGIDIDPVYDSMLDERGDEISAWAAENGYQMGSPEQNRMAADEWLAAQSEEALTQGRLTQGAKLIIGKVKQLFQQSGATQKQWSNSDILQLLVKGRKAHGMTGDTAGARFSQEQQQAPRTDGMYSVALETAMNAQQKKGAAGQWIAALKKGGTKQIELTETGVEDWLNSQPGTIERQDVVDYLSQNEMNLKEVSIGEDGIQNQGPQGPRDYAEIRRRYPAAVNELERYGFDFSIENSTGKAIIRPYGEAAEKLGDVKFTNDDHIYDILTEAGFEDDVASGSEAIMTYLDGKATGQGSNMDVELDEDYDPERGGMENTQYEEYTEQGGEDYRENLYTQPDKVGSDYHTSHFQGVRNIAAHTRTNKRMLDGKKTTFMEELQSDAHQEERDMSLAIKKGSPLDLPYKKTQDWVGMLFKKTLIKAVKEGQEQIAWTSGEMQNERYPGMADNSTELNWSVNPDGSYDIDNGQGEYGDGATLEQIESTYGADAANEIRKDTEEHEPELAMALNDTLISAVPNRMATDVFALARATLFEGDANFDDVHKEMIQKYSTAVDRAIERGSLHSDTQIRKYEFIKSLKEEDFGFTKNMEIKFNGKYIHDGKMKGDERLYMEKLAYAAIHNGGSGFIDLKQKLMMQIDQNVAEQRMTEAEEAEANRLRSSINTARVHNFTAEPSTASGQVEMKKPSGMESFYDKMLPNIIGDIVKKIGGKVKVVPMEDYKYEVKNYLPGELNRFAGNSTSLGIFDTKEEADEVLDKTKKEMSGESFIQPIEPDLQTDVWAVEITPEMKKAVESGLTRFSTQKRTGAKGLTGAETAEYKAAIEKGLPMNFDDRMKRAKEAGFDTDDEWYHASTHNITDMDASVTNPESDFGKGIYMTNNTDDAEANYAGEGPDLTSRITNRAEQIAGERDLNRKDAMDAAREELVGEAKGGTTYPLLLNPSKMANIGGYEETMIESNDFREEAEDEHDRADFDSDEEYEEAVQEMQWEMQGDDMDSPLMSITDTLRRLNVEDDDVAAIMETMYDGEITATGIYDAVKNSEAMADGDDGNFLTPGGLTAKILQDLGYEGVFDHTVNEKFGSQRKYGQSMEGMNEDTVHAIVFEGGEHNIRSKHAAFDPDNKDKTNILFSTVPLREGTEDLSAYGIEPGRKRVRNRELAEALESRQRDMHGVIDRKDRSDESAQKIADWMADEVEHELHPDRIADSAKGWYGEKYQKAVNRIGQKFPEVKKNITKRHLLTAMIAITSDGTAVEGNFRSGTRTYQKYRKDGKLEMLHGHGEREASVKGNLKKLQALIDNLGEEGAAEFLTTEKPISEWRRMGIEVSSDYTADTVMPGSIIFGPKVGAFFGNLSGMEHYLTMDRWWSRTFNRLRGELTTKPTDVGIKRFKAMLGKPRMHDKTALRLAAEHADKYAKKKFKNGTAIEKAANTITKATKGLVDIPGNATDRSFMLNAARKTQEVMSKRGYDLSISDIQAIMWYYEKRFYKQMGTGAQLTDVSFEEAAKQAVEEL